MGKLESKRNKASKRKSNSKELWTTLDLLQEGRDGIEEDSGLGDSVPFADEEAYISEQSCHSSLHSSLSRNGTSLPFATASKHERRSTNQEQKRLRLDLPEEANELPEEKYSAGGQVRPPLLSFKNVPALLSPLKTIQENALELRSTPTYAVQPLSIQRIAPANLPMTIIKEEEIAKKSNRHFLDKIYPSTSLNGVTELQLIAQPEKQHRARYQTEGSRGAVKDRSGQGHPIIKLSGYSNPAELLTYVAWDGGSVAPHMFYQAYKVSGKNSTPCKEEKIQGTTLLHMDLLPEKDMTVSCDCVGLLKERNVDVEQRLKSSMLRGRRKSTKCRLVFRTTIKLISGAEETLQIISDAICCTQPPGVPEICRKSISFCSHAGGQELFIIGKNFFKDTKVIFQDKDADDVPNQWKVTVTPDKDFLHQTHLICAVPPYSDGTLKEVEVQITVTSCGKSSEAHSFKFLSSGTDESSIQGSSIAVQTLLPVPSLDINKDKSVVASEASVSLSHKKHNGYSKEQAIVHPMHIRPFSSTPLYGSQEDNARPIKMCEEENTTTTATVFAPLATTLNPPQENNTYTNSFKLPTPVEPVSGNAAKHDGESNETVIENLVEMLKLARNTAIPSAQPAFVQMIADEILNQLKKRNSIATNAQCKKSGPEQIMMSGSSEVVSQPQLVDRENIKSENYAVSDTKSLYDQRQTTVHVQQYLTTPPVTQSSTNSDAFCRFSSVESMLVPSTTDVKVAEVKAPNYIISNQNTSLPLLAAEPCNSKTSMENSQSTMVISAEYVQSPVLSSSTKKINLRPVTVSRQTLLTNQQTFGNKEENSNQGSYDTINPLYLPRQHSKLESSNNTGGQTSSINLSPILPVSHVQSQLYQSPINRSAQTSCLPPNVEVSNSKLTIHNSALFNTQVEMQQNSVNLPVHAISQSSISSGINVTQNMRRSESISSNGISIADPLISQSPSRSELYTPQQDIQLGTIGANTQISNTNSINSTISSEVAKRFDQLSESELINYINPTCFDNV